MICEGVPDDSWGDGLFEGVSVSDLRRLSADAADTEGVLDDDVFLHGLEHGGHTSSFSSEPAVIDFTGFDSFEACFRRSTCTCGHQVWGATAHGEAVLTEIGRPMVVAKGSELEASIDAQPV